MSLKMVLFDMWHIIKCVNNNKWSKQSDKKGCSATTFAPHLVHASLDHHSPNDIPICSAIFAQQTTECPYTL